MLQIQHHEPGFLSDAGLESESLAQIHHRHGATLIGNHALQKVRGLG